MDIIIIYLVFLKNIWVEKKILKILYMFKTCIWEYWPHPRAWIPVPETMNFTIKVKNFVDTRIMHLDFLKNILE